MKTDELREKYLAFFESRGCVRRPSDVLVPTWDPSVLFTPAGMNQFKDQFLGKCKLEFTRATTCQKCLRTGDIDNVGRTAYHHTFFEMLGNFSFGDYFKREAIVWAWEFLTGRKWLALDPDRLSATVYIDDDEAAAIWRDEVGLAAERIERRGEDENFWPASAPSQGPDGVCGPCSEIYFHGPTGPVEIWNLVFTQFNRVGPPPDNLRPLPSKNIDTGMGLERTAAVLQGVDTNFHIDILRPIVEAAAEVCQTVYDPQSDHGRRLRRITDHVRACTFAIHENVIPGPAKEKYVIRRLLRRAVLDGHRLGMREPFLHRLVEKVAEMMRQPYPELSQTRERVEGVIRQEEAAFFDKIDAGLSRIDDLLRELAGDGRRMVPGHRAAELYQTYGFPPELLESLAAEKDFTFDWPGFKKGMEKHGLDSGGGKKVELFASAKPLDNLRKVRSGTQFTGYDGCSGTATVAAILVGQEGAEELTGGQADLVLDKSPFYGEGGGQVGDTGLLSGDGVRFEVTDTQRDGEFLVHHGVLEQGTLRVGSVVRAEVNAARRQGIRRAHTATHLLHHALGTVVGPHAQQQGSKVDDDWLRFDFASTRALSRDDLDRIEDEVNARVISADPVQWRRVPISEARAAGAMMLFGERYPDVVRMVKMGDYSLELCGGTHLDNTGQVGLFHVVGEESVAAGVRRITAITGRRALAESRGARRSLAEISRALRAPASEAAARIESLLKEVRESRKKAAAGSGGASTLEALIGGAEEVDGRRVIVAEVAGGNPATMRQQIDQLRQKLSPVAVLLAARQDDKVHLVAGISRELEAAGVDSAAWVRQVAKVVGGSGGGRKDLAQAGGTDPSRLPAALEEARQSIRVQLLKA
jgi:alanyl-tRNA synthetase